MRDGTSLMLYNWFPDIFADSLMYVQSYIYYITYYYKYYLNQE